MTCNQTKECADAVAEKTGTLAIEILIAVVGGMAVIIAVTITLPKAIKFLKTFI